MNCILLIYLVLTNIYLEKEWQLIRGVIDRIEYEQAVILLEDMNREISIPIMNLPNYVEENDWLMIAHNKEKFYPLIVDYDKTEIERNKSLILLERLRN